MQPRRHALAFALLSFVVLWLGGCPPPSSGDAGPDGGAPVVVDAGVDAGQLDAGCAGSLGCACKADGSCERGQCVEGTCTLCTRGERGCGCRADGSCLGTDVCRDGVCAECPAGEQGCACLSGACNADLTCDDGTCVVGDCPAGAEGCPCRSGVGPACDDGGTCLGDGLCAQCNADRPGCACVDDACADGLVCAGSCREPITCQDLVDDGYCGPNQACVEGEGGDAVCVPDECQPGFVFSNGECVPGRPNCTDGAPGSVLGTCSTLFRQCVETQDGAHCGECIGGAADVDGVCIGRLACGDSACFEDQYCDVTGSVPTCAPLPCAAGAALTSLGECVPCGFSCAGPGLTGRVWPFRSSDGSCICETTPGYFMLAGGDTEAERCDEDGDGWVRLDTRDPTLLLDGALAANARCGVDAVDTVVLRDEQGTDLEVVSCLEGLLVSPSAAECSQRVPLPLVESLRNDRPGLLPVTPGSPPYGERSLRTHEVNGLTKACVDGQADFNDNGQEDLVEVQALPDTFAGDPGSGEARLASFSYFLETHRAYVEHKEGKPRLVIEERRRCHPRDFPLRYDPAVDPRAPDDAYDKEDPSTYWRSCQRRVDADFVAETNPADPKPGFDFAQWSCPDGAAGCLRLVNAPPHRQDLRTPTPVGAAPPEDATLCELGAARPGDGVWRGMHHHSQFKCVRVTSDDVPAGEPLSAFGEGTGKLVFNACSARACPPGDASCLESRSVVPGASAVEPNLDCRAVTTPAVGEVGFAAVAYRPYGLGHSAGGFGPYERGCVNEDHEFRDRLCPAPTAATDPNWSVEPRVDNFGRQTCFIGECPQGRADCDGDPLNGCEQDATLNTSCGGCPGDPAAQCFPDNAVGECDELGRCQILECAENYGDCNHDVSDGCETSLLTLDDCGGCGLVCDIENSTENCSRGVCEPGACAVGYANCNEDVNDNDGCEAPVMSIASCGACDQTCDLANAVPGCALVVDGEPVVADAGSVDGGAYECVIESCAEGFADCDGKKVNGCESHLAADPKNCGACGQDCEFEAVNAEGLCLGGACERTGCKRDWADCDQDEGDDYVEGCEVHLPDDVENCGSCGNNCFELFGDTADPRCSAGACVFDQCRAGYANCDNIASNGCELDLAKAECGDAEHVGEKMADSKCGVVCSVDTIKTNFSSKTGRGSKFFKARALDEIGICSDDLIHEVELKVPDDADYDLLVRLECDGTVIARSENKGQGVDEKVTIQRADGTLEERSFDYYVEVVWKSGGYDCDHRWSITFRGRQC